MSRSRVVTSLFTRGDLSRETSGKRNSSTTFRLFRGTRPRMHSRISSRWPVSQAEPKDLICHCPFFRSSKTRQGISFLSHHLSLPPILSRTPLTHVEASSSLSKRDEK